MKYKNKVTELLKTVPEIKKDLETVKRGTKMKYYFDTPMGENYENLIFISERGDNVFFENTSEELGEGYEITSHLAGDYNDEEMGYEIIGNQLEERHLRIYCEERGIPMIINCQGGIVILNEKVTESDNTKSFDEQSEEVREQLFNFLNELVGK